MHCLAPCEFLTRKAPRATDATVIALRCPQDGKTLMLKTPSSLVAGHRRTEPALGQKLAPWWLAFTVPEDAVQQQERKTSVVFLSCGPFVLKHQLRGALWCKLYDWGRDLLLLFGGLFCCLAVVWLDLRPALEKKSSHLMHETGQRPRAGETIDPRGEPNASVL